MSSSEKNTPKKKIFIYARKSKFTKESESIETQIDKCRQYIELNFDSSQYSEGGIEEYCDEGWSGKDLNRPKFKKMYEEIKRGNCQCVVVYRLDRISRSVADFSSLLGEFQKHKVSFISVTEKFDTTSNTGHLMMVITSAFAEFERRIIAERVRDNMHKLAESGRWLGGTTPLGFSSEKVRNTSHENRTDPESFTERTEYKLCLVENEAATVKLIYDKFIELRALHKLETYLLNNNIKTRRGGSFSNRTLKEILKNPVYCTADTDSCRYFTERDCDLCLEETELTSGRGFIAFNKTQSDDRRTRNDISEWIIAVGKHKGIISGADWVKAQDILLQNSQKSFRKSRNPVALLSGVLKCSCGSYMRPKYNRPDKNGKHSYVYMCELKDRSKKQQCHTDNLRGEDVDGIICDMLLKYDIPGSPLNRQLELLKRKIEAADSNHRNEIKRLKREIENKNKEKDNYIRFVGEGNADEAVYNEIKEKISGCIDTVNALAQEIGRLEQADELKDRLNSEYLTAETAMKQFKDSFPALSTEEKREFIRKVIDMVTWDGENLSVFIRGSR